MIKSGGRVEAPTILGKPPRNSKDGEDKLIIGKNCLIRPFSTIYAGTRIGNNFQTGQGISIRENNIIGDDVLVGTNTVLEFGNKIGKGTRIHSNCFLEMVTLEEYVFIGPNVVFTDDLHPMNCPRYKDCLGGAKVKKFARIGAGVTILPGVIIGKNSLVGAGSVVINDVADNTVVVGTPARPIKSINDLVCRKGFFKRPYNWPPYGKIRRKE